METREELLNKLQGVKTQISRIMKTMDEQTNIVASFRESEASISTTGWKAALDIAKYAIGFTLVANGLLNKSIGTALLYVAMMAYLFINRSKKTILKKIITGLLYVSLFYLPIYAYETIMYGYIVAGIIPLVFFAAGIAVTLYLIRTQNKKIEAKNNEIRLRNAQLQEQYDVTVQRIKQQRQKLNQLITGWYPKDYCSLEAVNFFIGAISNYKADHMKEAVIMFDDSQHKQKMLSSQRAIENMNRQQIINQQEISKQLKFANMLNIINLSLQSSTQDAIYQNTNAVNNARAEIVGSVNRATDAINGLRK